MTDLNNRIIELETELAKLKEQLRDLEASQQATLFMLEDVNEAAAKIEEAKKEWEGTFDSITDPLFIHDKEFKIVRCNKAYAEAAGITFNHFIGKPYYEVFPKMEKPFKMCIKAQELQEEEEEEEEEEEFSCPVTNRIFKVRFYPIKDIDNKLLYSIHILEDITEAKRAAEKIKQEMEITAHLLMIAETTAHITDPDKLMEKVILCGHEITKCDVCLSYLWDNETGTFCPSHALGLSHELIPVFRTEPLNMEQLGMSGVETEIMVMNTPNLFQWLKNIGTIAAIPLAVRNNPLGLIIIIYTRGREIIERERMLMQGISHQVSTALEQARLYKESVDKAMELSHKIETIKVMHEIDRSILSALKPDDILETTVRMIGNVIPCDRATVGLVDKERHGFIYAAGFGVQFVPKGALTPFKDTSAAEIVKTGRPEYIANLNDIKNILPIEKGLLNEGFLSHIRVPLVVKNEVIGILTVGSKRASAFTPEDLSTLEKIASQIGVALENARLVSDLEDLFFGTIKTLSEAIDAKSKWTAGHSARVTEIAVMIGMKMDMDEKTLKDLEIAGLLHDIGKIGIYEAILDKPGKLTDEELKVMRQHPAKGAEILEPIKQLKDIIPAVKYHHEFYDGTGYPDGLKGEDIPLMARILGVADTIDAMGADRPYRKGRAMDDIIKELRRCSGTQFDPKLVEVLLNVVGSRL